MRSLVFGFLMLFASAAFAAAPAVLATTCESKSPKEANLIRPTAAEARQMLARKTEIALSTSLSSKFTSSEVTLQVDVDRDGSVECFSLLSERPEEKFTDDDKEELRGSLATGLNFWVFKPYIVNGQAAESRVSYKLQVEPKKLVLPRTQIPLRR